MTYSKLIGTLSKLEFKIQKHHRERGPDRIPTKIMLAEIIATNDLLNDYLEQYYSECGEYNYVTEPLIEECKRKIMGE